MGIKDDHFGRIAQQKQYFLCDHLKQIIIHFGFRQKKSVYFDLFSYIYM